jgi:hypothetical protein
VGKYTGSQYAEFITRTNPLPVEFSKWTPVAIIDTGVGNNKTFIVPANTEYKIKSIYLNVTTTATEGDRGIWVVFATGSTQTLYLVTTLAIAPSVTGKMMFMSNGIAKDETGSFLSYPLPLDIILPAGYKIIIKDHYNRDVLDTIKVQMLVESREV